MTTKQIFWATLWERNPIGECADTLLDVSAHAAVHGCQRLRAKYGRTDETRNQLATAFLAHSQNDDDTLVMLDNDHLHPPDVVMKLADAGKPVVGALAFKRGKPFEPCAYIRDDGGLYHSLVEWPDNVIGEVDCIGHAAVAIQRRALLQLIERGYRHTWWRYEYWDDGGMPSEDMYFAKICADAGVGQWVHTGVECPHHMNAYSDHNSWKKYLSAHPEMIRPSPFRVSVIIPSRHRPKRLRASIESLFATTKGFDVECIVVLDADDIESQSAVEGFPVKSVIEIINDDPEATGIPKWNMGASVATGDWLVTGADDVTWCDEWLGVALDTPNQGFIGLNDGHTDGAQYATHYMVSRKFAIEHLGGVLQIPAYRSWYSDIEVCQRAKRASRYVYAREAVVNHEHPAWGGDDDAMYERGKQYQDADLAEFIRRRDAGFPDDFEAVIKEMVPA